MAIKKSDLYSSLWQSCDELRGGMDASQYKDHVLFMLFIKYISDKYGDSEDFAPPLTIPPGASFRDMIALKGKADVGDKINKQVIQPLIDANSRLARTDFPDFNDPNKLGEGQAMVDRLTNLIGIFQKPELDFSKNRADNDDILGDAYEYLMRHFATESGKSKGQFYTPSEVSRIIAKAEVSAQLKKIKGDKEATDETTVLKQWLTLNTKEADLKRAIRDAEASLDHLAYKKYPQLTEAEVQTLVVDDKWLSAIASAIPGEVDRVSQTLTSRIRVLADRYASPLPQIVDEVAALAAKVDGHLKEMGAKP